MEGFLGNVQQRVQLEGFEQVRAAAPGVGKED